MRKTEAAPRNKYLSRECNGPEWTSVKVGASKYHAAATRPHWDVVLGLIRKCFAKRTGRCRKHFKASKFISEHTSSIALTDKNFITFKAPLILLGGESRVE